MHTSCTQTNGVNMGKIGETHSHITLYNIMNSEDQIILIPQGVSDFRQS
jgi:hypothetical protein